jgi:hypothetical protein
MITECLQEFERRRTPIGILSDDSRAKGGAAQIGHSVLAVSLVLAAHSGGYGPSIQVA